MTSAPSSRPPRATVPCGRRTDRLYSGLCKVRDGEVVYAARLDFASGSPPHLQPLPVRRETPQAECGHCVMSRADLGRRVAGLEPALPCRSATGSAGYQTVKFHPPLANGPAAYGGR